MSERPIAIAYTPTEPHIYYEKEPQNQYPHQYNHENVDETDEFGNPSRGEDYKQDFDAPFYPSIKLGGGKMPTDLKNSWAIVNPSKKSGSNNGNKIDRSDTMMRNGAGGSGDNGDEENDDETTEAEEHNNNQAETATEKFNLDQFQPELQGGFLPIHPPIGILPKSASSGIHADDSIEALVYNDEEFEAIEAEDEEDKKNDMNTDANSEEATEENHTLSL